MIKYHKKIVHYYYNKLQYMSIICNLYLCILLISKNIRQYETGNFNLILNDYFHKFAFMYNITFQHDSVDGFVIRDDMVTINFHSAREDDIKIIF